MIIKLLYITIINSIFIFYNYFNLKGLRVISEHCTHITLINRIRNNNNRFISGYFLSYDEKVFLYPQLFHWVLSFFSEEFLNKKYFFINLTIKLIEIVTFNLFLFYVDSLLELNVYFYIFFNILINIIPFSHAGWNAKLIGLSTRPLGLFLGQMLTILMLIYFTNDSLLIYIFIIINIFVIILSSQMATQYVLLSTPLYFIFTLDFFILFAPLIAYLIYLVILPKYAISYFKGQYYHKRNYALFMSKIFLFHYRYSVYRDFVYDFWKYLFTKPLKQSIQYIGMNPIMEVIYGVPFIIPVILLYNINYDNNLLSNAYLMVVACFILVLIISFRPLRFLGEPSRYIEFVSPIGIVLFIYYYSSTLNITLAVYSILLILVMEFYTKNIFYKDEEYIEKENIIKFFHTNFNIDCIITSNDVNLPSLISTDKIKFLSCSVTQYKKNKKEFFDDYENMDKRIVSKNKLKSFFSNYKIDYIAINNRFYSIEDVKELIRNVNFYEIYSFGKLQLFKVEYQ